MAPRGTKQREETESSSQPQESEGTASTSEAMIELLLEQWRHSKNNTACWCPYWNSRGRTHATHLCTQRWRKLFFVITMSVRRHTVGDPWPTGSRQKNPFRIGRIVSDHFDHWTKDQKMSLADLNGTESVFQWGSWGSEGLAYRKEAEVSSAGHRAGRWLYSGPGSGQCKTAVVMAKPPLQGKPIKVRPLRSSQTFHCLGILVSGKQSLCPAEVLLAYWPGFFTDIANYCHTCEVCQRSLPWRPTEAKMVTITLIAKPFQCIAMEFVGPLLHTQRGNRFILTMCDYTTRYPETIPLPSTEAGCVTSKLVSVFTQIGVPDEILTDQGSRFMSALLEEVYWQLNIQRIRTTPYHPRLIALLKDSTGHSRPCYGSLWAVIRRTGMSACPTLSLLIARSPRSLLASLHLSCYMEERSEVLLMCSGRSGYTAKEEETPIATYVVEMRDWLEEMSGLVQESIVKAHQWQKALYDRGAKEREFEVGDKMLVLLQMQHNRLKLE